MILYILLAILIFGVLIAVHEFGHFIAAKLCGVKVNEFSVGMGPAIWKKQKGETLYALRCVPLGGYCAMEAEDSVSDDPRAFTNQPVWKRLIILAAGSFNNFLTGLIVVFCLYLGATAFIAPVIGEFAPGCPYEGEEMLMLGDRFLKINGEKIYQYYDVAEKLQGGDGVYDIVLRRDGRKIELKDFEMVPIVYEGEEQARFGFSFGYEKATFGVKLRQALDTCGEFSRMVWMSLGQLVHGSVGLQDLSGPVGIVDLMAETGESAETTSDGIYNILYLGAFIAVNLAIMNMLPIPALDGGRIFFLLVTALFELIFRRKPDPKYEGWIHSAGMILLLGLMLLIMFNDILKLFK